MVAVVGSGCENNAGLGGASYFFVREKVRAYVAKGEPISGWEVEGVQGARGVGGALFHDAGGGAGDEGVASVWVGGEI